MYCVQQIMLTECPIFFPKSSPYLEISLSYRSKRRWNLLILSVCISSHFRIRSSSVFFISSWYSLMTSITSTFLFFSFIFPFFFKLCPLFVLFFWIFCKCFWWRRFFIPFHPRAFWAWCHKWDRAKNSKKQERASSKSGTSRFCNHLSIIPSH